LRLDQLRADNGDGRAALEGAHAVAAKLMRYAES